MPEAPPGGISRRDFLRRTAASAAIGAAATTGAVAYLEKFVPQFDYYGIHVVGGPVPRGLPLIPVRLDSNGFLEGAPSHLAWYRYCNLEGAPGTQEAYAGGNGFTYHINPEKIAILHNQGGALWYESLLGERVRPEHFPGLLEGARVRWRSEGEVDNNALNALLIKVDPNRYPERVRQEFLPVGFLGVLAACTHFCCVAGYREDPDAQRSGGWDQLWCTCHGGAWDVGDVRIYRSGASDPSNVSQKAGRPVE